MKLFTTVISLAMLLTPSGSYIHEAVTTAHEWHEVEEFMSLAQHTKDPTKCKKVCAPAGYDGEFPKEFPEGVETVECAGEYCARAGTDQPGGGGEWGEQPPDDEENCKPHHSCSVSCSEVCCICLRECI